MTHPKLIVATILLVSAFGPGTVHAAETNAAKPASAVQTGATVPECFKREFVKGHAQKILSIARLSAVRAWTEKAMKHGKEYSMWHYAQKQNIKCKRLSGEEYYLCFAVGKPCRNVNKGKTAANKAQ